MALTLKQYIEAVKLIHSDDMVLIKTVSSEIIYISESYAQLLGYPSSQEFLANYKNTSPNLQQIYLEQDSLILESRQAHEFLDIYDNSSNYQLIRIIKKPIVHAVSQKIVGIFVYALPPFNGLDRIEILRNIYPEIINLDFASGSLTPPLLTDREQQILFFLLYGKTAIEIANILTKINKKSISPNTIKNIINQQIKPKFTAHSLPELLVLASRLGFDSFIPHSLLASKSFHLCKEN